MKYICLGYIDQQKWESLIQDESNASVDELFAYDDLLRKNGHLIRGEALQSARYSTTVGWGNGQVSVTDGPFIETKEQLGGIIVLEAPDLNRAIQLISEHPSVHMGCCWEIRPAADLTAVRAASQRRSEAKLETT